VQVDPIKPPLKAPGSVQLRLGYDGPLSNFAFKFNSRRHTKDGGKLRRELRHNLTRFTAGAYTRPRFCST